MKVSHRFLRSSLLLSSLVALPLAGCYTQLASDKGDAWGYSGHTHHDVVVRHETVHSDTTVIIDRKADVATTSNATNDTVYVDDARPRTDYTYPSQTIVNNYYDSPYDYYYYPRHRSGFSVYIGIGDPYPVWSDYRYYTPWYARSWYDPYDNFYHGYYRGPGYYAFDPYYPYPPSPFYNCYAPIYSPDPYWYGRYGGGYYGNHGYYGDGGYYGNNGNRGGAHTGRIGGGERRGGSSTTGRSVQNGNTIQPAGNGNMIAITDRNAPVHSVAPGTAESGTAASGMASNSNAQNGSNANARATGNTSSEVIARSPIEVRNSNNSSTNTSVTGATKAPSQDVHATQRSAQEVTNGQVSAQPVNAPSNVQASAPQSSGHHVVVIHRAAPDRSQSVDSREAVQSRSSSSTDVRSAPRESAPRESAPRESSSSDANSTSSAPVRVSRSNESSSSDSRPVRSSGESESRGSSQPARSEGRVESRSSESSSSRDDSRSSNRSDNSGSRGGESRSSSRGR